MVRDFGCVEPGREFGYLPDGVGERGGCLSREVVPGVRDLVVYA